MCDVHITKHLDAQLFFSHFCDFCAASGSAALSPEMFVKDLEDDFCSAHILTLNMQVLLHVFSLPPYSQLQVNSTSFILIHVILC